MGGSARVSEIKTTSLLALFFIFPPTFPTTYLHAQLLKSWVGSSLSLSLSIVFCITWLSPYILSSRPFQPFIQSIPSSPLTPDFFLSSPRSPSFPSFYPLKVFHTLLLTGFSPLSRRVSPISSKSSSLVPSLFLSSPMVLGFLGTAQLLDGQCGGGPRYAPPDVL